MRWNWERLVEIFPFDGITNSQSQLLFLAYTPAIANPFLYAGMSEEFKTQLIRHFIPDTVDEEETVPIGAETKETNLTLRSTERTARTDM